MKKRYKCWNCATMCGSSKLKLSHQPSYDLEGKFPKRYAVCCPFCGAVVEWLDEDAFDYYKDRLEEDV